MLRPWPNRLLICIHPLYVGLAGLHPLLPPLPPVLLYLRFSHFPSCLLTPPFVWVDTDFLNSQFFFPCFLLPSPAVPLCSRPWIHVYLTYPSFGGSGLPLVAGGVLVSQPGIEPATPASEAWSLNHELPGKSLTHPVYSSSSHACPSSPFSLSFPSLFCCLPSSLLELPW